MSLNRVTLVGRLTGDPELKYTAQGIPVASLSVAVNRNVKNEAGEYEADFFNLVAWRQTAEFASNYLTKGRLVSVDGRLQQRSWVAQDGTKRHAIEIVVDNLQGLDRKPDGDGGGDRPYTPPEPASGSSSSSAPRQSAPAPAAAHTTNDDNDPFADD